MPIEKRIVVTHIKNQKNTGKDAARATRVYLFRDKESILENLTARGREPVAMYRRDILPVLVATAPELQGLKFDWSRTAGCSCGCSPGFIVRDSVGFDIFIDYRVEEVIVLRGKGGVK